LGKIKSIKMIKEEYELHGRWAFIRLESHLKEDEKFKLVGIGEREIEFEIIVPERKYEFNECNILLYGDTLVDVRGVELEGEEKAIKDLSSRLIQIAGGKELMTIKNGKN